MRVTTTAQPMELDHLVRSTDAIRGAVESVIEGIRLPRGVGRPRKASLLEKAVPVGIPKPVDVIESHRAVPQLVKKDGERIERRACWRRIDAFLRDETTPTGAGVEARGERPIHSDEVVPELDRAL